jgi:sigma-B regulation protein RsbU (phosphoserine phosphatase)
MKTKASFWIILTAAISLEAISCTMYFTSRAAIRNEAKRRAQTELRKAELEIQLHTVEAETAAKGLALLAQKHLNNPEMIYEDTRMAVRTLNENTSLAVAFIPDYFPGHHYFEMCSSRYSEDSIYTRQIGSDDHDYTQMEWYQNGFVHDSCWWCEPYLDNAGARTYVVSCSCPVYDSKGKVVAVICVDLSLDYLENLVEYLQVYPNSSYSIRSSNGTDIVSLIDTTGRGKYIPFEEEIDATGWHIEIIIPEDELFRELNHTGLIVSILMLVGLGLLIFIVWHTNKSNQRLIETTAKNQRMEGELEIAQTIQKAMLPKVFPPFADRLDLNIYGMVRPAKEIGGDLYDFYVRHEKLFFCVGDVSGKGVPASLVMATIRSLFRSVTSHEELADRILTQMNDALSEQNEQNMFVTLFVGVLDLDTGDLHYCNAGHNAPVIMANGEWRMVDVLPNLPVGIMKGFEYQAQTTTIHHNDVLFLYTDGLTEAENKEHAQYGDEQMLEALAQTNAMRPRQIVETMEASVASFVNGAEQSDDLTMLAIRYQDKAILMRNDIQQIPTLAEWVEGIGVPDELNMPINLALEEAVTNVMLYAYPGRNDGKVYVEYTELPTKDGKQLIFTISDSGIPFDPTQKEEADITLSAEERSIGGLGIHLVRQLMDEIRYERSEDKNILTLVKKLIIDN